MSKNIYEEIDLNLPHIKLFETIKVDICISPSSSGDTNFISSQYKILELTTDITESNNVRLNNEVIKKIEKINKKIHAEKSHIEWKLFYLIKELLQSFVGTGGEEKFNYFRGQASDWELVPGIFRKDISESYVSNFENIYRDIAYEYPHELKYIEYSNEQNIERSKQLAILQHYGLRTSLVDITKNPYIAMLFMVSDSSKNNFENGTIDLYRINESEHQEKNIFMPVAKSEKNKRLSAQKGAFFDYDSLFDLKKTEISTIDRIIIKICYPNELIEKQIRDELSESEELINYLEKHTIEDIPDETKPQLIKMVKDNIEQLKLIEGLYPDLKNDIFDTVRKEIKNKLEEYFYFEKNLFPDLDKYIGYIQSNYIEKSKPQKINFE